MVRLAHERILLAAREPSQQRTASWVVELGPEAGEVCGRIVFEGLPSALARASTGLVGAKSL